MTDIDEDLVKLANSLFNSEEVDDFKINLLHLFFLFWLDYQVLNPVVNYSPVVNPENPSFDPFEEYTPPASGFDHLSWLFNPACS